MTARVCLQLSLTGFDALHDATAPGRGTMVSVDRQALALLVADYLCLITALQEAGIEVVDPPQTQKQTS